MRTIAIHYAPADVKECTPVATLRVIAYFSLLNEKAYCSLNAYAYIISGTAHAQFAEGLHMHG